MNVKELTGRLTSATYVYYNEFLTPVWYTSQPRSDDEALKILFKNWMIHLGAVYVARVIDVNTQRFMYWKREGGDRVLWP